ncbi:alanyl-tRNA editing protein [Clostridium sp. DL1XJH146]
MTIKLYESNPYKKECVSLIEEIIHRENKIYVTLDKTIFFPEEGGQLSDNGYIDDIRVINVSIEGSRILHELEKEPLHSEVTCKLNWIKRLDHMQQHCGEHILSAAFLKLFNAPNLGFHMGEDYVTIDINLENVSKEMIFEVENYSNNVIFDNIDIDIFKVDKDKADKLPLRKELKVEEDIRIVQIKDVDIVACCGTHPKRTGEIGIIKILKTEKYKDLTRVYFNCGMRALKDYQSKHEIVTNINRIFSTDDNSILEKIIKNEDKIKTLNKEIKLYKFQAFQYEGDALISSSSNIIVDGSEIPIIKKIYSDKSFDDLQDLAQTILNKFSCVVFFASNKDNRVIMMHDGTIKIHCGKIFKNDLSTYNGKGGGGDKIAQGIFKNNEDLNNFFENINFG